MMADDIARLPNQSGVGAKRVDKRQLKADLIVRLAERLKEIGEGMASCNSDEQFQRMAMAKNEYAKIQDEKMLIARGMGGPELDKMKLLLEEGTHRVFQAANSTVQAIG